MWMVWKAFWGELNVPSNYRADPANGGANQAAHWTIGIGAASALCLVYALAAGELPPRWGVLLLVVIGYAVIIEKIKQSWAGPDSVIDTAFVGLGAALPMAALEEKSFVPDITLALHEVAGLVVLLVSVAAWLAYVIPRAWQKYMLEGAP